MHFIVNYVSLVPEIDRINYIIHSYENRKRIKFNRKGLGQKDVTGLTIIFIPIEIWDSTTMSCKLESVSMHVHT